MDEKTIKKNQRQDDRIEALEKGQEKILELLKPMADNYMTALKLGKWLMASLLFLSVLGGVILTWLKVFNK